MADTPMPTPEGEPQLTPKRWVLKHVLVPVLLACVPIYGTWAITRREAKTNCQVEAAANRMVVQALIDQLRATAEDAARARRERDARPMGSDTPVIVAMPVPALPAPEPVDLAPHVVDRILHDVPNASQEQAQEQTQQALIKINLADLPPGVKGHLYERMQEQAQVQEER